MFIILVTKLETNLVRYWNSIERIPLFYRLKKIQEKKKILKEKSERDLEQRRAAGEVTEPANLLAEEKDEDLLFE